MLERVRQLQPVQFRYSADIEPGQPLRGGFIAQQVQQVFPEAVQNHQGMLYVDLDVLEERVQQALRELKQQSA